MVARGFQPLVAKPSYSFSPLAKGRLRGHRTCTLLHVYHLRVTSATEDTAQEQWDNRAEIAVSSRLIRGASSLTAQRHPG